MLPVGFEGRDAHLRVGLVAGFVGGGALHGGDTDREAAGRRAAFDLGCGVDGVGGGGDVGDLRTGRRGGLFRDVAGDREDRFGGVNDVDDELVALTMGIVVINSWNRLAVAFRAPAGSYQPRTLAKPA